MRVCVIGIGEIGFGLLKSMQEAGFDELCGVDIWHRGAYLNGLLENNHLWKC